MSTTSIEWATHVWNPFTGCDRVSPGCAHCYAAEVAAGNQRRERGRAAAALAAGKPVPTMRYQRDGAPRVSGPGFGFTIHEDKITNPERFPAGARVFVNSMSDLFHEAAPPLEVARVFGVMAARPDVQWLVLTKRAARMRDLVSHPEFIRNARRASGETGHPWPLPNVWLGVTVENRRFLERVDVLRATPAAVRWVSAEPLLGPLVTWMYCSTCSQEGRDERCDECGGVEHWPLQGESIDLNDIDWIVVGGESGPKHRRFDEDWARDLRDLSREYGTQFFMKQMGGRRPGTQLEQLPAGLQIRELPTPPRTSTQKEAWIR